MALKIDGLLPISQLSKGDQILVYTSEGLVTLSSEVLGNVFSDTSLFDNKTFSEINEINSQYLSTHNKLRKWFASDITDEIYLICQGGNVNFVKETVILDVNTGEPLETQATSLNGKRLYWTADPSQVKFRDGLPWVTDDKEERRVTVTDEETDFPVKVYQYYTQLLKSSEIFSNESGITIKDTYTTGLNSSGIIKKSDDEFLFELQENNVSKCGLNMSKNEDGTYSVKLIGTWENVNDWDIDDVIKKSLFKDWFYNEQDAYTYIDILSVNTANKIKWRLNSDTQNKVYSVIEDNYIKFYYAQIVNDKTGMPVQELVKNKLGNTLYWDDDMDNLGSVDNNGIPVFQGKRVYPKTEQTDYPVHVYKYIDIEIFSIEYSNNNMRLKMADSGNKYGEIVKDNSGFTFKYYSVDNTGKETELSKIVMGNKESKLEGVWKMGDKELIELPDLPDDSKNYKLTVKDKVKSWGEDISELPDNPTEKNIEYYLSNIGGVKSWKGIEKEIPELPTEEIIERLILSYNSETKTMEWVKLSELIPQTTPEEPTPEESNPESVGGDTTL